MTVVYSKDSGVIKLLNSTLKQTLRQVERKKKLMQLGAIDSTKLNESKSDARICITTKFVKFLVCSLNKLTLGLKLQNGWNRNNLFNWQPTNWNAEVAKDLWYFIFVLSRKKTKVFSGPKLSWVSVCNVILWAPNLRS